MTEWQPIETAPKDGTKILIYVLGEPIVCWWAKPGQYGDDVTGGWFADHYHDMYCYDPEFYTPTHWQPLPPPPA